MLIAIALSLPAAHAQAVSGEIPDINVQNFRPNIDSTGTLWVDDSEVSSKRFMARVLFHYALNPLVYEYDDGEIVSVVSDVLQADVTAAVRVWKLRIGADIPVYLLQAGSGGQGFGLGDIGLDAKFGILDRDTAALGLALDGRLYFPTATVTNALGSPNTGWEIDAIVDKKFGKAMVALNLGVHGGPKSELENVSLDDFLVARLAGGYAFSDGAGLALEFAGEQSLSAFGNPAGLPIEAMASGYGYVSDSIVIRGGVGTGLTGGIGAPDFRIALGLGYEPREKAEEPSDKDGDGINDDLDACPKEPEDKDGWEDQDGCPDLDNDADGLVDTADKCPDDPEDKDGVADSDGCPEPEVAVAVKLINAADGSPIAAGRVVVKTGDKETSGGPDQKLELLPGAYEAVGTAINFESATVAFEVGDKGSTVEVKLAPKADSKLVVTRDRIDLREKVYFDTNQDTIQARSNALLDQVAQVMKEYPEIKLLRVEGHTDSRADDAYNLELSQRRADAVRTYLIGKGVEKARLTAKGFGESKPLDTAETEEAWEKNRRVEIFIEAWEAAPTK